MEHNVIQPGEIHSPYQWVVADESARLAITPEGATDIHKLCLQLDTEAAWRLSGVGPATWVAVVATAAPHDHDEAYAPIAHASATNNPHSVTKAQVGLGSVDNTSDSAKPVSTAQAQADTAVLNAAASDATTKANAAAAASTPVAHASATNNPHSVTKAQVGLGSVDNTADSAKPVSTDQATAIALKLDATHAGTGGTAHANAVAAGAAGFMTGADKAKLDGITGTNTGDQTNITGNAESATRLQTARNINGILFDGRSDITIQAVDATSRIASSEKGVANGVATLDASGKVQSAQLPSYVDDVLEFANLAAFPATGATGVIYVTIDTNKTYRWSGSAYVYITSGAVDSVNGQTGAVVLGTMSAQAASAVNIDGGTIDGTVIGGTTPAAGSFTELSAAESVASGDKFVTYENTAHTGYVSMRLLAKHSGASKQFELNWAPGVFARYYSPDATPHIFAIDGVNRVTVDGAGLAVTGALSASGNVLPAGVLGFTGLPSFPGALGVNGGAYIYGSAAGGTLIYGCGSASDVTLCDRNGVARVAVSSTGLAVTGALTTNSIKEDAAGNFGLGVVPKNWGGYRALQIGQGASLASVVSIGAVLSANAYNNNGAGWKYASNGVAMQYEQYGGGHYWHSAPSGTAGDAIDFGAAKMTLDASGNLLVGTTSTGFSDSNSFVAQNASGMFAVVNHLTGTASGAGYAFFGYGGNGIGSITQSGTTAVAYNTTSDHRLKENVRPANVSRFNDIEFVDFEWVDGRHDCGVLAHQLQSIYPDLVIGEKDATEIRQVEISPAIPAVTEQQLVTPAVLNDDGEEIEAAVYETVEVTSAVEAVFEDQEFPVYQQVNYIGLIGRMGTRIQIQDKQLQDQALLLAKMEARLALLEAA